VDDLAIGRVFRMLRIRLGWTQGDAAAKAGISRAAYSAIERGHLDTVALARLRRVAAIYEVRLLLEPRWRGAALDRALSSRHASMSEDVTRLLVAWGWEVRPEVSFNHFGERGVVDLVAWHGRSHTVLLVELKTELVDINGLLTVTDRRRRLVKTIVEQFGWRPEHVGQWIVVAESRTNRRRLAEHRTVLRTAFPGDGRSVPGWLTRPGRAVAALWFLPYSSAGSSRQSAAPQLRVRRRPPSVGPRAQAAQLQPGWNLATPAP
jgi:transcriptional regulator with XRE-family HTH domain